MSYKVGCSNVFSLCKAVLLPIASCLQHVQDLTKSWSTLGCYEWYEQPNTYSPRQSKGGHY